jgi:hypothetical protein
VYLRILFGRIYFLFVALLFGIATRVGVTKIFRFEDLQAALRSWQEQAKDK